MRRKLKSALIVALCAVSELAVMPADVFAGPMGVASQTTVELTASVDNVRYRRYPRRYYRRYGYDPSGAIFAGAALGIMGAGIAAASRPRYYGYGYPYGYGYGYGYPGYGWGW